MASSVGAWRAAWLLAQLRLRRQFNQLRSAYRFRKSSPARSRFPGQTGMIPGNIPSVPSRGSFRTANFSMLAETR